MLTTHWKLKDHSQSNMGCYKGRKAEYCDNIVYLEIQHTFLMLLLNFCAYSGWVSLLLDGFQHAYPCMILQGTFPKRSAFQRH